MSTITTVESIAELTAMQSPIDGQTIYVKSYHAGLGRGGDKFVFKASDTTLVNDVTVFNAIGGRWFRYNWKSPDIYDAGIDGSESDSTTRFQALVDAATALFQSVNLRGKTVKITQLDVPSNIHLFNGGIDVSASTWQKKYGRAAMMFKSTDRNAAGVDYEDNKAYANVTETKNIKFVNVNFKAVSIAGLFFKFDGMQFINCSGSWDKDNLFKFVGGWSGTPLVNDTPTSYNLVDPINGRNKNILIKDCNWKGGYVNKSFSSPFRFIACEDVFIEGGKNDCPLGWHIDTYNKGFTLESADYVNTNQQIVLDSIAGTSEPDMFAMYVGQNSYDINISGGRWKDFGRKGIYFESCSQVTVNGVLAKCTNANSVALFADLQPNWRENTNTYWGNVADVSIKNCSIVGVRNGVITSQFDGVSSLRGIRVEDNLIVTNLNLSAISIAGSEDYTVANNNCNGSLYLGRNNGGGSVIKNRFLNASNYALYIDRQLTGILPSILNNEFYVATGNVIYNNAGTGKAGQIVGGKIQTGSGHVFQLGEAGEIVGYSFENGVTSLFQTIAKNISVGGNSTSTYTQAIVGLKNGWTATVSVNSIDEYGYDLEILASVKADLLWFSVKNRSNSAVNFTPNLQIKLNIFSDQVFVN